MLDIETDKYYANLREGDLFWETANREIVAWLDEGPGRHALDIGCGAGGMTALLAEAVAPYGSVAALDIRSGLLELIRHDYAALPCADCIRLHEGSATALPFPDAHFDLVWCSHLIHGLPDPMVGLREARRVLKAGGRLALREDHWFTRFLPFDLGIGTPGLEYRLDALWAEDFARFKLETPGVISYPKGWTGMLREAGFGDVRAKTFLLELQPPFTDQQANYIYRTHILAPLYDPEIGGRLLPEDRRALEALADQDGPHFVFDREDLYFVSGTTVYVGYT